MNRKKALEFAKFEGYDGIRYVGQQAGFFYYVPFFHHPAGEEIPPTGLPCLIIEDQAGNMRFSSPEEAVFAGNAIRYQIEQQFTVRFGGRFFYAEPDGRFVYHYRGRDYLLEMDSADPEAVMKESLERGKNLVIKAFPVVDLYPDPNCVY